MRIYDDAGNESVIENVLVGDVWFCSGQSNMELPVERVKDAFPEEFVHCSNPFIRTFKIVENVDENVYLYGNSLKLAQVSEEWDICNEEGCPTGEIIERADAMELGEGMYHKVVSIYCITPDEKILITQRSIAKSHPHRWEVTCGSVLAGESERQGAVRELKEETGLEITEDELIPLYKYTDKKRHCVYYGYMIPVESADIPIVLEPDETDSYKFMPLEEFYEFAKTDDFARSESERLERFRGDIEQTVGAIRHQAD